MGRWLRDRKVNKVSLPAGRQAPPNPEPLAQAPETVVELPKEIVPEERYAGIVSDGVSAAVRFLRVTAKGAEYEISGAIPGEALFAVKVRVRASVVTHAGFDFGEAESLPAGDVVHENAQLYRVVRLVETIPNQVLRGSMDFKIPHAWLSDQGVSPDDVVLKQRDAKGNWISVPVRRTETTETEARYQAQINRLGIFAILAEKRHARRPNAP